MWPPNSSSIHDFGFRTAEKRAKILKFHTFPCKSQINLLTHCASVHILDIYKKNKNRNIAHSIIKVKQNKSKMFNSTVVL